MESKGKAIQFIEITQIVEQGKKNYQFELTSEAIAMLDKIKDQYVSVVSIAGPQRTGQSFLANRLLKQQTGFAIGPTTNPCTKGIWIWSKPIQIDQKTVMLLLDTEGLNSVQRDQTIDMKIFSISILLSSIFIYNNLGHIDEQALENLSLVIKLSENICVKKANDLDNSISDFFPTFFWVLRDFSLDLQNMTPRDYLESVLKSIQGIGPEVGRKNEIREKLRKFFPIRECQCFVRPIIEEDQLSTIESQDYYSLRPAFIEAVESFEKQIQGSLRPKMIQNKPLTANMFVKLTLEYLQSINSGGVPTILTSLERVIASEQRNTFQLLKNQYLGEMNKLFGPEKMPFEQEDFYIKHRDIVNFINDLLESKTKAYLDTQAMIKLKRSISLIIEQESQSRLQFNMEKSKNQAAQIITQLQNKFGLPQMLSVDDLQPSMVKQKYEQFSNFMRFYREQVKGPIKYKHFFETVPRFLFGYFDKLVEKIQQIMNEQHQRTQVYLQQAREGQEALRRNIKEYDSLILELQKEREIIKRENDLFQRELEKNSQLGQFDQDTLILKIKQLQQMLDSKKHEIVKYEQVNEQLEETIKRYKVELNSHRIELQTVQKQISETEKSFDCNPNSADGVSVELLDQIREIKQYVDMMEDFFQQRKINQNIQQSDIEILLKDQEEQINQIREVYQFQKEEAKKHMEEQKNVLKQKISILNNYIDELKSKLHDQEKQVENLEHQELQLKNLCLQNQKLNEALSFKVSNQEATVQVLNDYKSKIQKQSSIQNDLEQQLAFINAQKSSLLSYKSSFPYVLSQSLKWVMNQSSNLKHALKTVDDEDMACIRETFENLGIKLNF